MRTLANAQSDGIVVADEPAREADQDRPEGRQPWPLRHILNGRGHGVTADVRRNLVADCPGTSAARTCITRPGYGRPRRQRCALTRGNLRIPALQARIARSFCPPTGRLRSDLFCRRAFGTQNRSQWAGHLWKMGKVSRPCVVVLSRASVRLRNPMHLICRFSMASINCFVERASRSNFHTTSGSSLRANSSASCNAGRCVTVENSTSGEG